MAKALSRICFFMIEKPRGAPRGPFARSECRAASEIVAFRLFVAKQIVGVVPTSGRHRFSLRWPMIENNVTAKEST
jgi:hypothetical protein